MLLPSIVTRKRLATTRLSSPSLSLVVPLLEAGVAADVDRLLVAVARLLFVSGREEHRPRRDQQLAECRVDDLHVDLRVALRVVALRPARTERAWSCARRSAVALPARHLGQHGLELLEAHGLDRLAVRAAPLSRAGRCLHRLGELLMPCVAAPAAPACSAAFFSASAASLASSAAFSAAFCSSDFAAADASTQASERRVQPFQMAHSNPPRRT